MVTAVAVLIDFSVRPVRSTLDADEEALVDQAVCDGGSRGGILKELAPLFEGQVGGDDGRAALVATIEDLVQQVGAASVEAEVAELVEQDQVIGAPGAQPAVKCVLGLGGHEVVDDVGGRGETDTIAAQAGELADGIGKMRFADARRTDKDDVGALLDEVEGGGAVDDVAVDELGCRFSRSSTGCFSRMFVMGRALFPGMEGTLIGADAVV